MFFILLNLMIILLNKTILRAPHPNGKCNLYAQVSHLHKLPIPLDEDASALFKPNKSIHNLLNAISCRGVHFEHAQNLLNAVSISEKSLHSISSNLSQS